MELSVLNGFPDPRFQTFRKDCKPPFQGRDLNQIVNRFPKAC